MSVKSSKNRYGRRFPLTASCYSMERLYHMHHKTGKCPICGEKNYARVYYTDTEERFCCEFMEDRTNCKSNDARYDEWHVCIFCNRPIYYHRKNNETSNRMYIFISSFLGWRGPGEKIWLAIDTETLKATCNIMTINGCENYPISETLAKRLVRNKEKLLEHQIKDEESHIYDDSFYYFCIFYQNNYNTVSFQGSYLKKHLLFFRLVSLIIEIHENRRLTRLI